MPVGQQAGRLTRLALSRLRDRVDMEHEIEALTWEVER